MVKIIKKLLQLTLLFPTNQALVVNSTVHNLPTKSIYIYTFFVAVQCISSGLCFMKNRDQPLFKTLSSSSVFTKFDYLVTFITGIIYVFIGIMSIFGLMPQVTVGLNIITLIAQIVLAIVELVNSKYTYDDKFAFCLTTILSIFHLILMIINFPNPKCAWMSLSTANNKRCCAILGVTSFIITLSRYANRYGLNKILQDIFSLEDLGVIIDDKGTFQALGLI